MRFRKTVATMAITGIMTGILSSAAMAAGVPANVLTDTGLLRTFGIIKGDENGNLNLDQQITRAELMAVLVRGAGKEQTAKLLKGAVSFTDVDQNAWFSGDVAMAKAMKFTVGYPDGSFQPNNNITYGEAITLIAREVGIQPTGDAWPMSYIMPAVTAGVIPAHIDVVGKANLPVTRGDVFEIAEIAFKTVQNVEGKNLFQQHFDIVPPVVTVNPITTTDMTKVTVSGKASDAVSVKVAGNDVALGADGSFVAEVAVTLGTNTVEIVAADAVGNVFTLPVKVERVAAAAKKLTAPAAVVVKAGTAADLIAEVTDAYGEKIANPDLKATVSVEGLGEFKDGKFFAGKKAQTGTLTITVGELKAEVAVTVAPADLAKLTITPENATVAPATIVNLGVKGVDAYDNEITGLKPVFALDQTSDAILDTANGSFIASKAGSYAVTAAVGEIKASAKLGVYGVTTGIKVATVKEMVANATINGTSSNNLVSGKLYDVTFTAADVNGNANLADDSTSFDLPGLSSGLVFYAVNDKGNAVTTANITAGMFTDGVFKAKVAALSNYSGQVIDLTADVADTKITDGTFEVSTVEAVAKSITLDGIPKSYATNLGGIVATGTIKVLDQTGVAMTGGNFDAKVTVTGAATINDNVAKTVDVSVINGVGSFTLNGIQGSTGTVTVSASIPDLGSVSANLNAVVAGPAVKFLAEITDVNGDAVTGPVTADGTSIYTVTVKAVDAQGVETSNNLPTTATIDFGGIKLDGLTFGGSNYDSATNVLTLTTGTGTFNVKASKFLGTLGITAKHDGYTAGNGKVEFVAGAASKVALATNDGVNGGVTYFLPLSNPTGTVTAQLYDAEGNKVAKAGVEVTFTAYKSGTATNEVTLDGKAQTVTVKTDATGTASVAALARQIPDGTYTVKVGTVVSGIAADTTDKANELTFQVKAMVVEKAELSLLMDGNTNSASSVDPDINNVNVKVVLKDQYGAMTTGLADYLSLNVGKVIWNTTDSDFVDNTDATTVLYKFLEDSTAPGTYWLVANTATDTTVKASVNVAKAGVQSIGVKYTGSQNAVAVARSLTVRTGAYAGVQILENGTAITAKALKEKTVSGPFTIRLVDKFGNFMSTSAKKSLNLTGGSVRPTTGGVDDVVIQTSGSYTFYVSMGAAGTTKVITFTDSVTGTITNTITFTAE